MKSKIVLGTLVVGFCGILLVSYGKEIKKEQVSADSFVSKEKKEPIFPALNRPESYNHSNNEVVSIPEIITPVTSRSAINEAATKEELTTRMLNSIDFFSNAKGQLSYNSFNKNGISYTTDFVMNKSNMNLTYEETNFDIKEDKLRSAGMTDISEKYVTTFDSKNFTAYNLVGDEVSERVDQFLEVSPEQMGRSNSNENGGLEDKISLTETGEPIYELKYEPNYLTYSKQALLPEDLTLGILKDFDKWEIVSNEEFAGIQTKRIEGQLNEEYRKRYLSETFIMNVDPMTGILLRFESYLGTEVKEQMIVNEIELNSVLSRDMFITTKEEVANEK